MALIEELEKQGKFLFRWRSYIPVLIGILCIFQIPELGFLGGSPLWHRVYELGCFLISFLGQGIRFFVVGTTPAHTSGRNTKTQIAETLNQTGVYSVVRHPLYLANFFMYLGVVLLVRNLWILLLFIAFFALYYERIMFAEESFLRSKFGEDFTKWAENTPAFLPKFSGYVRPSLPFSGKTALRREYQGLFGLILIFLCFDIAVLYFQNQISFSENFLYGLEPWHKLTLLMSLIFYTVVRILHKFTKVLEVEGRW